MRGDHLIALGSSPDAERAGTGGQVIACLRESSTGPPSPHRSGASCRRALPRLRAAPAASPGLSIVLVGDKPDSQIYVNSKLKSAGDEGMTATLSHLPASTSLDEILSLVHELNADAATDGILVQAPLPDSLGAGRDAVGVRCDRSVEGRRRRDAGERRAARAESRGPDRVHAGRHRRAAAAQRHRHRRKACGRHRAQRHRRQAGVDAPPASPRDRDGLSFAHAGSADRLPRPPTFWWPRLAGPASCGDRSSSLERR